MTHQLELDLGIAPSGVITRVPRFCPRCGHPNNIGGWLIETPRRGFWRAPCAYCAGFVFNDLTLIDLFCRPSVNTDDGQADATDID